MYNNEIWKDVEGYEGLYQISNLGRVKRILFKNNVIEKPKDKILKTYNNGTGYRKLSLYKNNIQKQFLIHRLVAKAFLSNLSKLDQVNHIDGNKENNRIDNLEWVSQSKNIIHSYKTNLRVANSKNKFGSNNPKAIKVKMIDYTTNEIIKTFDSIIDAAHYIGKSKSCHIVSCCKGRLKKAYGYKWEYNEVL